MDLGQEFCAEMEALLPHRLSGGGGLCSSVFNNSKGHSLEELYLLGAGRKNA